MTLIEALKLAPEGSDERDALVLQSVGWVRRHEDGMWRKPGGWPGWRSPPRVTTNARESVQHLEPRAAH